MNNKFYSRRILRQFVGKKKGVKEISMSNDSTKIYFNVDGETYYITFDELAAEVEASVKKATKKSIKKDE